jgi:putative membrane protein
VSEDQQPPGPIRQRADVELTDKAPPARPVERLRADDPAVMPEADITDAPHVAEGDAADELLAQSIATKPRRAWLWRLLVAGLGLGIAAFAAWLVNQAIAAAGDGSVIGLMSAGAMSLVALALGGLILAEIIGLARLRGRGALRGEIDGALESGASPALQRALANLAEAHGRRPELAWVLAQYRESVADMPDAGDRLVVYERTVLGPLDEACLGEIARVVRRTAVLTTLSPNPVLDAGLVLWLSLSVIRAVARVQGLRPGLLASGALVRRTATAMVAAGAMEVLHDVASDAVAGGLVRKVAGRVGHGAVNGFLTARLGVAALEATRPMPYRARNKPSARGIVAKALVGMTG